MSLQPLLPIAQARTPDRLELKIALEVSSSEARSRPESQKPYQALTQELVNGVSRLRGAARAMAAWPHAEQGGHG